MKQSDIRQENRRHSSALVPFSYYKSSVPEFFPCVPLHWHKEFELNFIREGTGMIICADNVISAKEGDIFLIRPNMLHSVDSRDRLVYDTVVFSPDMLLSAVNDRSCSQIIRPLISGAVEISLPTDRQNMYYAEMRTCAENIVSCAKNSSPSHDILMKSELLRLIWLLRESGAVTEKKNIAPRDSFVSSTVEYMTEHSAENISVEMLAQRVHLSKSCFMHRFSAALGIGAIEYLNRIRVRKACELLLSSDGSVSEIAFDCGFRNLSNFNRQFRSITGCSPVEYKKKMSSVT